VSIIQNGLFGFFAESGTRGQYDNKTDSIHILSVSYNYRKRSGLSALRGCMQIIQKLSRLPSTKSAFGLQQQQKGGNEDSVITDSIHILCILQVS